jgi:hypothetical protein
MKSHLLMVVVGLGSGMAGALLVGHLREAPAPRPVVAVVPSQPAVARLPPGWDRRPARVEQRIAELPAQRAVEPSAAAPEPVPGREVERAAHYQHELELKSQLIADHEREVVDPVWSAQTGEEVRALLAAQSDRFDVRGVDCRGRTCVADLVFPRPEDALAYIQGHDVAPPASCNGLIAIPSPPESDGPYDLSIVYTCR